MGYYSSVKENCYICIDLKSFYASVECVERGLDPMTTDLVVADPERGDKTICLAVSPSLKAKGVKNRCRVFEIPPHIKYIKATPRMQKYIDYAAEIYGIYLRYLSPEDIYVYSIDEAFLDCTTYLDLYGKTPREMAVFLMDRISEEVGVRATAGIGTNLYLAKIALDITAKHSPDFIGILDEDAFRAQLWSHRPLTDFWRIGRGTEARLERFGLFTMGQIAHAPEELLYKEFGIDAEILIDHAWGLEPCGMKEINAYRPETNSLSEGQVLSCPYSYDKARIIVQEMTDSLVFQLTDKGLVTDSLTLDIGYDRENCDKGVYHGPVHIDHYGRTVPKGAHGSTRLDNPTNLSSQLMAATTELFDRIDNRNLTVRRITIAANRVVKDQGILQVDLFTDTSKLEREKSLQTTMLGIKKKFGKNAVLKGTNYLEGATMRERNGQIGGHKAK